MNADRLLGLLVHTGALVGTDRTGALVADRVAPEIATVLDTYRADLSLAARGRATGHRFAACSECHRTQLIETGPGHSCKLTPRCPGKVAIPARGRRPRPIGRDPYLAPIANLVALLGPQSFKAARDLAWLRCSRAGCAALANHLTAAHEPLCDLDFLHLALTLHHRKALPR